MRVKNSIKKHYLLCTDIGKKSSSTRNCWPMANAGQCFTNNESVQAAQINKLSFESEGISSSKQFK